MLLQPSEPYVCGYCGRKCKTNEKLKKHFRDLHERERNKRMNRLNSLKGNKRDKFRVSLSDKEEKYVLLLSQFFFIFPCLTAFFFSSGYKPMEEHLERNE